MARRILPRRLSHDEEASLVEHLTELRHRLFICLVAIIPAFAIAYAFHDSLIERLMDLAPRGHAARHARRHRAVHHLAQGELLRRDRARAADHPLADLGVPRAGRGATPRSACSASSSSSRPRSSSPGVAFCYLIVLPRALDVPRRLRLRPLHRADPGELLPLVRRPDAARVRARVRDADLHPRLVRLGVLTADRLRSNRRIGYVAMLAFAILLPTVDPVSLVLEVVPLLVLFELSIWLAVLMERRWERRPPKPKRCDDARCRGVLRLRRAVRVLSADWVVPVEGEPIADGAVAIDDDGRIAAVGPASELGAASAFAGCVILPGLRQLPHPPRVRRLRGFGDGLPFSSVDRAPRRAQAAGSISTTCARSRRSARTSASARASRPSATAASRAPRPRRRRRRACARSSTSRSSAGSGRGARARSRSCASGSRRSLSDRRAPRRLAARPLHLHRRALRGLRAARASDRHASRRERSRAPVPGRRNRRLVVLRRTCSSHLPGSTGIRMLADAGLARQPADGRPLRRRRGGGDRPPRASTPSASRTARARTGFSAAGSPRSVTSSRQGSRSGSPPTARLRPRPSTSSTSCARPSWRPACARAPPGCAQRRTRRWSSRRSAARASSASTARSARSFPGKWADVTVVSLEDSPLSPVEDPVVAAVLGGSPERVAATLVAGEDRYRRGTSAWPDSRRAARRARSRMLR